MKYKPQFLFILFLFPTFLFGQSIIHKIGLELIDPEQEGEFLFYSGPDTDDDRYEFTKLCFVRQNDTICFENEIPWAGKDDIYENGDVFIDEWMGIFKEKGKTYFWLTSQKYLYTIERTTILAWDGEKMEKIFEDDFRIFDIVIDNGNRYLVGMGYYPKLYGGNLNSDYQFRTFQPVEFREISGNMRINQGLVSGYHLRETMIEDHVDIYDAVMVRNYNENGRDILISREMEKSIKEREYGAVSLSKLSNLYFEKLSREELKIFRNEIFAYYGYDFPDQELKTYFEQKDWYKPTGISLSKIYYKLTEIERYNIDFAKELEKTR